MNETLDKRINRKRSGVKSTEDSAANSGIPKT